MKTDYTVISRFRNKEVCEYLVDEIGKRGKTCYNFCEVPADPNNPDASPEEQQKVFESTKDFYNDEHFQMIMARDLEGLKNAEKVILLLPAGLSAHMEAGIAYGLGKPLIMVGKPEKPEALYLLFNERYETVEDFLARL
jgi:hypothetical protein